MQANCIFFTNTSIRHDDTKKEIYGKKLQFIT